MNNKFHIGICELYNEHIHGRTKDSNENIDAHYVVTNIIKRSKFMNNGYLNNITNIKNNLNTITNLNNINKNLNKIIINYDNIIKNTNYIKLDIFSIHILDTKECIAVIKTHFIRLIQKHWKNVLKERKRKIQECKMFKNLLYREVHGNWIKDIRYLN